MTGSCVILAVSFITFFASFSSNFEVFRETPMHFDSGNEPKTWARFWFNSMNFLRLGIFMFSGYLKFCFSAQWHNIKWVGQDPLINGSVAVLPG